MDALLRVSGLTVTYRSAGAESPAVVDATFEINPRDTLGLLGESGCGKSTMAASLLRLLPRNASVKCGSIRFRGKELSQLSEREIEAIRGAEMSLIFQEPSIALNPVLRVRDQVAEVILAHRRWSQRRCRDEAEELLRQVQLADARLYDSFPHQLSGGEKQRVLIAQALACRPALLIADEPTSGLDSCTQSEILELFKQLKERFEIACLFISHDPGVLARVAARVMVMYAGRIVEQGSLDQIYASPLHPYTRALLSCMPEVYALRQRRRAISGSPPDMRQLPCGCAFAPRCPSRIQVCGIQDPPESTFDGPRRLRCFVNAPAVVN